ncbi:MAG: ComF family protein [Alphaproteobacteria bacterium]|nr:ComF family protein [Alphaproteobacteria bacterium]
MSSIAGQPRPVRPRPARLLASLRGLVDSMLPPRCLHCQAMVEGDGALCPDCWPLFDFLAPPLCDCCGFPFEYDPGPHDTVCGACLAYPPHFDRARSVLVYGENSRKLILDFKHGDRTWPTPAFGRWLARAGSDMIGDADLAVPVPLHRSRLYARRYNQASLLALAMGRETGLDVEPELLTRHRPTPSQGHMSRLARQRNVRGAFRLRHGFEDRVHGNRILLIDDVFTTGATAGECARTLKKAGAAAVDVLTLARVVRPRGE